MIRRWEAMSAALGAVPSSCLCCRRVYMFMNYSKRYGGIPNNEEKEILRTFEAHSFCDELHPIDLIMYAHPKQKDLVAKLLIDSLEKMGEDSDEFDEDEYKAPFNEYETVGVMMVPMDKYYLDNQDDEWEMELPPMDFNFVDSPKELVC